MTIGSNYPTPVTVNGFSCKNCTDVDYAKKHIDPAHPKSGPYGITAKDDPTVKISPSSAVVFGGNLSGLNAKQTMTAAQIGVSQQTEEDTAGAMVTAAIGSKLDVSA